MNDKDMCSRIETEFQEIASRNAWPLIYQKIGKACHSYPYTCLEAKKPHNKPLNRYRDVNPYDHSRITLKRFESDYINANLVKMDRANRKYILTQGPLTCTVGHFWLMVWEQDSRAVIMLNKVIEKEEVKCHWYWPQKTGAEHRLELEDVRLAVEQISEEDCGYYITRRHKIFDLESEATREVIQFHYTTWPDFGVPTSPVAFLKFLKRVRDSGALEADVGPAVVHCSAGIGRSGTFCLVDSCLVIIEKEGLDNLNVQEILLEMRRDRMGLIQTPDQLRFSYQAIIEGAKRLDPDWEEPSCSSPQHTNLSVIQEYVDTPPPPPPRGESLARPPARPLPAIPISASLGDLKYENHGDSDSSEEGTPTSPSRFVLPPTPGRFLLPPYTGTPSFTPSPTYTSFSWSPPTPQEWQITTNTSSADDEDEEPPSPAYESGSGSGVESSETTSLRRRRARDRVLSDRVAAMKRKARDAERWHALKRLKSEEKPKQGED